MYPEKEMLVFHVESSLHAGSGSNIGHIDNPLQRETATGNPIVQANGVKGALREFYKKSFKADSSKTDAMFGSESGNDGAGAVAFGEARLLFFPVRSLAGIFAYISCPTLIYRLQRDLTALGKQPLKLNNQPWYPSVPVDCYQAHSDTILQLSPNGSMILEELPFEKHGGEPSIDGCLDEIAARFFPSADEYAPFKDNFPKRVAILNDEDFFHFVKYATEVEPHNRMNDKGTVDETTGVWYTEYLPSESILYSTLFIGEPHIQNNGFQNATEVKTYIQKMNGCRTWIGGDRTTGKGRVMMYLLKELEG
ncbi:MAG: type III-B CRISPR module RAMP protein Cmr4 [Desulfotignum sp.]|nr:type III-B CRISPR module RAMP protein Cmr4 [Desulfotignum sp.]